ncbi:AEC family transporter [Parashewanella curva]|uniref:AEC family transporter n=1 Tax=Parashewanella curva TaxID=2338552 RepID=A0A3L8PVX0_9GAMM|nr:AEC family transporter [Parashewanella curva]RLV58568.1 AEC family transporter [Parashewanella curva]
MLSSTILPLLIVISLGYVTTKLKYFDEAGIKAITRLFFYICIPALLFSHMATADVLHIANTKVLLAFYVSMTISFGLYFIVCRYIKRTKAESAVSALGANYSNVLLVGLPVILIVLGQEWAAEVFVVILFHSLYSFTVTYFFVADRGDTAFSTVGKIAKSVFCNPVVLSISLGALFSVLKIPLPNVIETSLELISSSAIAGGLFVLGANLYLLQDKCNFNTSIAQSLFKLFVLPTIVYLASTHVWPIDNEHRLILVILAGSPVGVNAYLLAHNSKILEAEIAGSVFISTLLSMFSFSFWLAILL